ncbi:spermidine/putrescine ABC transporter permease PotC [Halorubrum ezzemoulense DSM 17463]|uniref:Spermidine/putrescine ABC transporter permease PotC n=3 Tax=Halorubrum ezzemoulense TaxID=337243 RepID=A0A1X4H8M0_HALEZ|nr:ABC transporter permease [Halorubrum sp. GN12_10-3_MGM]OSP07905.1 spermidine/putrescine ABC transporter permease PotC [Halorubrum ezzemoulense DSM 17463]OYR70972.1 spermidine/putrescine ABC transporter permease PotC [Halorubrum ezzemoulense]TKX65048.1 ABC transporter permease [Halorubrum sp. GN12_10-3_MGM]
MGAFRRARAALFERGAGLLVAQTAFVYLFLYLPIAVLITLSFNDSRYAVVWQGFTTKWYTALLQGETVARVDPTAAWNALLNSVEIAVAMVVISTVFGTMLAFALDRYDFPGKRLFTGVVFMPIIIPSIVMGISLLLFFNIAGIQLGTGTAIIGHVAFGISFVAVVVAARLQTFDQTMEEAAMDLGANELETLRFVTLPMIKPGIFAGALLAFAMSFDDYVVTFFIIGQENTLPIFFFGMVRQGISPGVNVVAALIIVVTMALVAVAQWFQGPTW